MHQQHHKSVTNKARPEGMPPAWVQALGNLGDQLMLPGLLGFSRIGPVLQKNFWSMPDTRLDQQTVIITGATAGIGPCFVKALAARGARLLLIGRDSPRMKALSKELRKTYAADVTSIAADMGSLTSLDQAMAQVRALCPEGIQILVNNAGGLYWQREMSADGYEKSFAVNLLAPVFCTNALLPLLVQTPGAKVLSVSSGGMYTQRLQVQHLKNGRSKHYDGNSAYAQAKRGLVIMNEIWAERHATSGVMFLSMHPGWTETQAEIDSLPVFQRLTQPVLRRLDEGADTLVWLALTQIPANYNGTFWFDRLPRSPYVVPGTREDLEERHRLSLFLDICLDHHPADEDDAAT